MTMLNKEKRETAMSSHAQTVVPTLLVFDFCFSIYLLQYLFASVFSYATS